MDFKKRETQLFLLVVVCLGIFLGDQLVYSPMMESWTKDKVAIAKLEKDLVAARKMVVQERTWSQQLKQFQTMALPKERSEVESKVLGMVGEWGIKSRLNLTSLQPKMRQDTSTVSDRFELKVSGEGSMEAIGSFLYMLETSDLPLAVEDVDISSRDDAGKLLNVDFRMTGPPPKKKARRSKRSTGGTSS